MHSGESSLIFSPSPVGKQNPIVIHFHDNVDHRVSGGGFSTDLSPNVRIVCGDASETLPPANQQEDKAVAQPVGAQKRSAVLVATVLMFP